MHRPAGTPSGVPPRGPGSTGAQIHDLSDLRVGDVVEIRRWDTVRYHGVVDVVCPRLGVLWILDGPLHDRTMVHACEYTIWRMPRPLRAS